MGLDVVNVASRVWYVPDVADNRKDADPMRVLISPATVREVRATNSRVARLSRLLSRDADVEIDGLYMTIIKEHVHEVVGYTLVSYDEKGETKQPITTVDDLVAYGSTSLLNDVYGAIMQHSQLRKGLERNWCWLPGSPPPTLGALADGLAGDPGSLDAKST